MVSGSWVGQEMVDGVVGNGRGGWGMSWWR